MNTNHLNGQLNLVKKTLKQIEAENLIFERTIKEVAKNTTGEGNDMMAGFTKVYNKSIALAKKGDAEGASNLIKEYSNGFKYSK